MSARSEARSIARRALILEAPVGRAMLRLAGPNALAMSFATMTSLAEGIYAARLGPVSLAAVAVTFPFVIFIMTLSGGAMGGAISAAIARASGRGDLQSAARLSFHGLIIALSAAAIIALIWFIAGERIFAALTSESAVLAEALSYGAVFFPGAVTMWCSQTGLNILRGSGRIGLAAIASFCTTLLVVTLSGVFSLGLAGAPAMGVPGLALGIILGYGLTAVTLFALFAAGAPGFNPFQDMRLSRSYFRQILRQGLLATLSPLQTAFLSLIMVAIVARVSVGALAGFGLGGRLEMMLIPAVAGIGTAVIPVVGQNIGAGQAARARRMALAGAFTAGGLATAIGVITAIWPQLWLGLFLAEPSGPIWEAGAAYLRITGPFYGCFAFGLTLYFAAQGAGQVGFAVFTGTLRVIVAVLCGLAAIFLGLGVKWVFAGLSLAMFLYCALTAWGVLRQDWTLK